MPENRGDHGDAIGEYWAARQGNGLVVPGGDVIWVRGSDAVTFIDGQVSQDVGAMSPGEVRRSLLLGSRGKLIAPLWVLRGGDAVGLVADVGGAAVVRERLAGFIFRVDVELQAEERPVAEIWGTDAALQARRAGLDPGSGWRDEGALAAVLAAPALTRVLVAGADEKGLAAAGLVRVGTAAATAVRIEAGEPLMGVDLDESVIPQEAGLVSESVSFTKGCYVGQELVARIDSRGHVNRRLAGIRITENIIPPPGAEVVVDGSSVGVLTSVAESQELAAPVALALVHRRAPAGTSVAVTWGDRVVTGVVMDLPMVGSHSPSSYI